MKACQYLVLSHGTRILRLRLIRVTDSTQSVQIQLYARLPHITRTFRLWLISAPSSISSFAILIWPLLAAANNGVSPSYTHTHNCMLRDRTEVGQHLYLPHRIRTLSLWWISRPASINSFARSLRPPLAAAYNSELPFYAHTHNRILKERVNIAYS